MSSHLCLCAEAEVGAEIQGDEAGGCGVVPLLRTSANDNPSLSLDLTTTFFDSLDDTKVLIGSSH